MCIRVARSETGVHCAVMDPVQLHREAVVIDGHTDLPTRLFHQPADVSQRLADGHVDLPRLREGGVSAFAAALYVPATMSPEDGWRHLAALHRVMSRALVPGELERVVTAADVRRAQAAGVVGVLSAVENGRPLTSERRLRHCAELGVRYVTLTHFASHEWCDASTDQPRWGGLSDEGVKRVREMRRLGILPDVSHVSDDAVLHTLDAVRSPVIASHSSCRTLCDQPRNLPDSLVRDIARSGGVVMAVSYPAFVSPAAAAANEERFSRWQAENPDLFADDTDEKTARESWRAFAADNPLPAASLADYVDHIVRLIEVAGEEHVGVGSDFDGITDVLDGFEDVSRFGALTAALLERGLSVRAVRQVLGESFLAVLAEAERWAG